MYAYVDETGNTGNRVFDPQQPLFITAATITRGNFDLLRAADLKRISTKLGVNALHARELGVGRIEDIADDLRSVIKGAEASFFLSRVEKAYLAASKIFDTYFDPHDNKAVSWQAYNVRPLRLMLTFKISAFVLTEQIAEKFFKGIVNSREAVTREKFLSSARDMLEQVDRIPDSRSREIVRSGLEWALENPESFSIHIRDKLNRNMHSPNFVAFTNLLQGLDDVSRRWKRKVREIVHDRQTEFERTFATWHEIVSDVRLIDEKPIRWFGEDIAFSLGRTPGSQLRLATEESSAGLQVTDVVLWLFKRTLEGKEIGPRSARLLNRVFQRGYQNDFSFKGVGAAVEQKLDTIMSAPMSAEQLQKGHDFIALSEQRRLEAMQQYMDEKAAEALASPE